MALYPTKSKDGKSFLTFKNILLAGLILFVIWLLTCNRKSTEPEVQQQVKIITRLDSSLKHEYDTRIAMQQDSFSRVAAIKDANTSKYYSNWQAEVTKVHLAERLVEDLLNQPVPDTCKHIVSALTTQYNGLKASSRKAEQSALSTINGFKSTVDSYKARVSQVTKDRDLLRRSLDTCISAAKSLGKLAKPRGEIFAGINTQSGFDQFNPTMGLSIGYHAPNGLQVEIGANLRKEVSFGIKKRLFKL